MPDHVLENTARHVLNATAAHAKPDARSRLKGHRRHSHTQLRQMETNPCKHGYYCRNKPVDTSLSLFGRTFKYPVFAGPVGAVQLHYGDCLDDVTYNDILVSACAENGIAAFTGDGTDPNVMVAATKAIKMQRVQEYLP